jgi:hypothetical protein
LFNTHSFFTGGGALTRNGKLIFLDATKSDFAAVQVAWEEDDNVAFMLTATENQWEQTMSSFATILVFHVVLPLWALATLCHAKAILQPHLALMGPIWKPTAPVIVLIVELCTMPSLAIKLALCGSGFTGDPPREFTRFFATMLNGCGLWTSMVMALHWIEERKTVSPSSSGRKIGENIVRTRPRSLLALFVLAVGGDTTASSLLALRYIRDSQMVASLIIWSLATIPIAIYFICATRNLIFAVLRHAKLSNQRIAPSATCTA